MKPILAILILLGSISCRAGSRIQKVLLKSNMNGDSTSFSVENDTLHLWYDFYGDRGPVTFTIYNKLNIPIYIDWKKSAFITEHEKYDYWYDISSFNAENGITTREDRITFIPPHASITNTRYLIKPQGTFDIPKEAGTTHLPETWRKFGKDEKPGEVEVKEVNYTLRNSPLVFRNFLTLSTSYHFDKEFYFDHYFWVSQVDVMDYNNFFGTTERANETEYIHPYRRQNCFYIK